MIFYGYLAISDKRDQKMLSEVGSQHVWETTRTMTSKNTLHIIAYRNRTGRITMYVSTSARHSSSKWTIVPKN